MPLKQIGINIQYYESSLKLKFDKYFIPINNFSCLISDVKQPILIIFYFFSDVKQLIFREFYFLDSNIIVQFSRNVPVYYYGQLLSLQNSLID